jgi:catechol 2,3-dioxygenase-like lactoylglutathione lyase family enzyme
MKTSRCAGNRFVSLPLLAFLTFALFAPLAAQKIQRPKILGIAHIGLRVSDIEKSRAFYKDFLGLGEPFLLNKPDGSLDLTFIKVNDYQYIELFPGLKTGQDRLSHISIYTDDAERMRQYLASRGVKVPERVPKGRSGNSNFNVDDPDGHSVEIVEYEPDGWSMRDKGKAMSGARISDRMLHLGILVGNLAKSMEFYNDILGFEEFWRGASRNSDTLSWVNMRVPDGPTYLEFMLYKNEPAPDHRGVEHHIALEVDDAAKAVERLEQRPYFKTYEHKIEIHTGVNRRRQVNLYDPDGTRIELMEATTVDGKPPESSKLPAPRG